jgi:hypothetical protein
MFRQQLRFGTGKRYASLVIQALSPVSSMLREVAPRKQDASWSRTLNWMSPSGSDYSPTRLDILPSHPARFGTGQKGHDIRDLLCCTDALEWR